MTLQMLTDFQNVNISPIFTGESLKNLTSGIFISTGSSISESQNKLLEGL